MEITDFLTQDFLSSFTGTLIAVELIVFITKDFPLINKIPTKIYTLILAIIHLVIVKLTNGTLALNIENFYRLFINSLVVALILCGGYDTIMAKFKSIKDTLEKATDDIKGIEEIVDTESKNSEVKIESEEDKL